MLAYGSKDGLYPRKFQPRNPKKYSGDVNQIVLRSSWEAKFAIWCDSTDSVKEWGSEVAVIPYISPVDNKPHRYFVDFYVKVIDKNGLPQKYLVEIKPSKFTAPPKQPAKKSKAYIQEVFQWGVNEAKWKAATNFCENRGWKFIILTEKELVT